ncbi:2,4-dihydroxyhept-2-ene-1,7-dioic acid aldolase [Mycena sanguinolenta]|uniref:2,4-dihydroxyhept-2-ene-1,7-dioic acid aldolase n=1 Tax=Mycena sanguinolenta TaxID=230812 RepID=A0A8H7DMT1_9AGAR|nr:2,4-dihydroxyhept-2-ene-1,7-dioic acid aldolase [Mycena sanguinolenta]
MNLNFTPRFTADASKKLLLPPTLQQPSNLQGLLKSGKVAVGIALSVPSTHVAKIVAVTGADWCWIDMEHVAWSPALLVECIQIIIHESAGKMIPIVRVPAKTSFDHMAWCLDAGAGGLIIPHIETVEEMKAVIAACRFPPIGHRSFSPFAFVPGVTDITPAGETVFSIANKHVALIPQIESNVGIANLDAILSMGEVSSFMLGLGDLRLEMNLPLAFSGNEPEFVEALQQATKISKKYDKPFFSGAFTKEMIKERLDQGGRLLLCGFDLHFLAFGIMSTLGDVRATVEEHMQGLESN